MAESSTITIAYWAGFKGLGDKVKRMAEFLKIPYTFKGYTSPEEWGKDKTTLKTDFPNLPYIIDGDKVITESDAEVRYLIHKAGRRDLLGKNGDQEVEIATLEGVLHDTLRALLELLAKENPKYEEEFAAKVLSRLERVDKHIAGKKWALGDDFTIADVKISEAVGITLAAKPEIAAKIPHAVELHKKVEAIPELAAYNASDRTAKAFLPAAFFHIKI